MFVNVFNFLAINVCPSLLLLFVLVITARHLKYVSLVVLALQNAALIIVMRYVRTRPGDMFASTTAVVMTEILKVATCLVVIWYEEGMSVRSCGQHLNENIIQQPWDCVRVSVPAFIYMIQNNLIYVAASNLDVATFQVKNVVCVKSKEESSQGVDPKNLDALRVRIRYKY